jgi:tetratricopeptide (TPR) repeat protein
MKHTHLAAMALSIGMAISGCASLSVQTQKADDAHDYAKAIELGQKGKPTDDDFDATSLNVAVAYYSLGQYDKAIEHCNICLQAAKPYYGYGAGGAAPDTASLCRKLRDKVNATVYALPENVEKRRLEKEAADRKAKEEADYNAATQAADAAAKAALAKKMAPYWSKAVDILRHTVELQTYVDRDTRLRDDTRTEVELKLIPGPSDQADCVTVEAHLSPRANWRAIRMDTLINQGASPSEAKRVMNPTPVSDALWATFRVNVKTRTVYSVDNWASQILQAQNYDAKRAKELKEYYQQR